MRTQNQTLPFPVGAAGPVQRAPGPRVRCCDGSPRARPASASQARPEGLPSDSKKRGHPARGHALRCENQTWTEGSVGLQRTRLRKLPGPTVVCLSDQKSPRNKNKTKPTPQTKENKTSFSLLEKNASKEHWTEKVLALVTRGTSDTSCGRPRPAVPGNRPGLRNVGCDLVHRISIKVVQTASLKKDVY